MNNSKNNPKPKQILNTFTIGPTYGINLSKNKIKMFVNWLDHVSFEDLAIDYQLLRDTSSEEFRQKLAKNIQVHGKDCGVFTPKYHIQVYCPSVRATGHDELRLMFNEYPGNRTIQVKYKINK